MYSLNSGYQGFSMSKRAAEAYDSGEMPKSHWKKSILIEELESRGIDNEKLFKYSKELLCEYFLYNSSWHHCSKMCNKVDFYSVNEHAVENFLNDPELVFNYLEKNKKSAKKIKKQQKDVSLEIVEIEFGEWGGTRRHPKLIKKKAIGVKKGDWVWIDVNSKKSLNGKRCNITKTFDADFETDTIIEIKKSLTKNKVAN